jgi:[ribosomal protein S18]-alanine N-acetyltransferase
VSRRNSTEDDPPAERVDGTQATLRLRRFRDGDLETLHRIDQSCFPPGIAYSLAELENLIRRPDASTWVAEAGENIVGFVVADCERRDAGHIITLDVKEGWRHGGVGTALMNAAEAWVRQRGAPFMYLETAEDNTTAQNFYRRRGYQKLRGLENYYGKGATAWLMAKRFADWHAR